MRLLLLSFRQLSKPQRALVCITNCVVRPTLRSKARVGDQPQHPLQAPRLGEETQASPEPSTQAGERPWEGACRGLRPREVTATLSGPLPAKEQTSTRAVIRPLSDWAWDTWTSTCSCLSCFIYKMRTKLWNYGVWCLHEMTHVKPHGKS